MRSSGNRVVVAGGSGLVGSALVSELVRSGSEVVVLSRTPGAIGDLPAGVRALGWDGRAAGEWESGLEGAAAVVNLCGANIAGRRWSAARKSRLRSTRIDPTRALIEAIGRCRRRPAAFLQASAIGIYGARDAEPIDESTAPGDDFLSELGREWEAASSAVDALEVRRVVLRTGIVLSRAGGALARMLTPFRLGLGGRLGDGEQGFSWIHSDDAARAIRFLVEEDAAAGPFNLTAPAPVSNRVFTAALAGALRRPAWLPVPPFALRALFGELAGVLLSGQFVLPARLTEAGFRFRFPTLEGALTDLLG